MKKYILWVGVHLFILSVIAFVLHNYTSFEWGFTSLMFFGLAVLFSSNGLSTLSEAHVAKEQFGGYKPRYEKYISSFSPFLAASIILLIASIASTYLF